MKSIEAVDVVKTYLQGKVEVHALAGVSLAINAGEFAALAGPSGSGKTTLLNLFGGLDAPNAGQIFLDGQDITALSQSKLANMRLHKIGFVFQAYNIIPVLSAQENVEYVMLMQGVPTAERRDRARQVLDDVGLGNMYSRRPAELSGGQQQRVAVARAIVSNPTIVLADEPTANLDSKTGQGLLEMMCDMNESRGVTFVFSTHDQMVMDYARRLIHLKDGQIVDDISK
ncbi:ABC transporter ATP-binding protein [Desulfobaculum bizertense]|uniref:Putative ABC transport system ATP-binding protein n=1 Tax=Desulfobaculum bizertense DSM 18034 TaxID=1121442 RepID=A0A1T4W960_9BACT|nr:ABC transporter ATP-binding protein [Desulfobaculum bizertense]SKA73793.1 putative ABC transport system ATP-binding protein [Desulfobaculum bizertense DSM 18034]